MTIMPASFEAAVDGSADHCSWQLSSIDFSILSSEPVLEAMFRGLTLTETAELAQRLVYQNAVGHISLAVPIASWCHDLLAQIAECAAAHCGCAQFAFDSAVDNVDYLMLTLGDRVWAIMQGDEELIPVEGTLTVDKLFSVLTWPAGFMSFHISWNESTLSASFTDAHGRQSTMVLTPLLGVYHHAMEALASYANESAMMLLSYDEATVECALVLGDNPANSLYPDGMVIFEDFLDPLTQAGFSKLPANAQAAAIILAQRWAASLPELVNAACVACSPTALAGLPPVSS